MASNIFSTYSAGENRVTASILAVLSALSLDRIQRLIGALIGSSEFELVRFQNQPSKGGEGIPDAVIAASCRILVETKTVPQTVNLEQLRRHVERLKTATEATKALLVLTPDDQAPSAIGEVESDMVVWSSFAAFDQAIEELLGDKAEVVSEREAFLLRELQELFSREKLLRSPKNILVVPARNAWPEYQRHSAYICQPDRPFQPVDRIAFYADGEIKNCVPRIRSIHDRVVFERDAETGELGDLIRSVLDDPKSPNSLLGEEHKIILLTAPDDSETLLLESTIPNDLVARSGRPWAFVLGQRYVSEGALRAAITTTELVSLDGDA